jgi:hypothetical protein
MNDSAPLTPEQIDLLLSADLDGEFDAAASDLGLEPVAARALLESVPTVEARRAGMGAARDLLAGPIEIDELLAARLRTKAMRLGAEAAEDRRGEQRRRRTRQYGILSGVAATLVLVVAVGATLNGSGSSNDSSTEASGALARAAPTVSSSAAAGRAPTGAESSGDAASDQARTLPLHTAYASLEDLEDDVSERRNEFDLAEPATVAGPKPSGVQRHSSSGAPSDRCEPVASSLERANGGPLANGLTKVAGEPLSALLYLSADGRTLYFFDEDCKLVSRQFIS